MRGAMLALLSILAVAPTGAAETASVTAPAVGIQLAEGRVFRDCAQCPQMVVIPAGNFLMGSPSGEKYHRKDEGPQHRVTVRRFAIGKYEVTFAEWDACVAAGGCGHRPGDEGWGRGRRPVINVSWDDAKQYVAWLSRRTGKRYRLPSEAEWEYAARAGTRTAYHWGTQASHQYANYGKDKCCGGRASGRDRWVNTAPVGSFPPNRLGLHDVSGNVFERVEDCWHKSYAGAPANGRPWTTGGDCSKRVLRGGSWNDRPEALRSAFRYGVATGNRKANEGFRVVRTLP